MDTRHTVRPPGGHPCTGEWVPDPAAASRAWETDPRNRQTKGSEVAAEEPVTSPDQHKPGSPRAARIGAVVVMVALLAMICGNHKGRIEDIFLVTGAGLIAAILVGDWLLRKNGLR